MKSVLFEHFNRIESLKEYLKLLSEIKNLSNKEISNLILPVSSFLTFIDRRKYEYNLAIINLYGIFESFIEKIIVAYLRDYTKLFTEYALLPEKLTINHLRLSTELISSTNSKYEHILKETIVKNLHSCMSNSRGFSLNLEAFTQHSANFRKEIISQTFANINITDMISKIKGNEKLINFLLEKNNLEKNNIKGIKCNDNLFFGDLDDLIERRNCISHGNLSDDLLSEELIILYADYIKLLINAIYDGLEYNYNYTYFDNKPSTELEFKDIIRSEILCVFSNGLSYKQGDVIFAFNETTKQLKKLTIQNLQIDNIDFKEITSNTNNYIGILLDSKIKPNYKFYKPL